MEQHEQQLLGAAVDEDPQTAGDEEQPAVGVVQDEKQDAAEQDNKQQSLRTPSTHTRLVCLDIQRGLTIGGMIFAGEFGDPCRWGLTSFVCR